MDAVCAQSYELMFIYDSDPQVGEVHRKMLVCAH